MAGLPFSIGFRQQVGHIKEAALLNTCCGTACNLARTVENRAYNNRDALSTDMNWDRAALVHKAEVHFP